MNLYLDTEFDGFGGELISIALVGPGVFFYEVCDTKITHPWVKQHVEPVLHKAPIRKTLLKIELWNFLKQFHNPTIYCDWYEDAIHFFNLFGGAAYASSFIFPCRVSLISTPPGEPVSKIPHNALADAQALMEWHQRTGGV